MFSHALIPAHVVHPTRTMLYDHMIPYEFNLKKHWLSIDETNGTLGDANFLTIWEKNRTPSIGGCMQFASRHELPIKNTEAWLIDVFKLPKWDDVPAAFEAMRKVLDGIPFDRDLRQTLKTKFPWLCWWGKCGDSVSYYVPLERPNPKHCHRRRDSDSDSDDDANWSPSNGLIIDFNSSQPFKRMWLECRLFQAINHLSSWNEEHTEEPVRPFPPYPDARDNIDAVYRQYKLNKKIVFDEITSRPISNDAKEAEKQIFRHLLEIADSLGKNRIV